jgi:hypothetical protein
MRARRSVSLTLALGCVALLAVGARQCPVQEMLEEVAATLDAHEDRLGQVVACGCCCDGRFELVCGDDGHTYLNECEADCAGVAVKSEGRCEFTSECDAPNPAGCAQNGCPEGQVCFRDGTQCVPSACTCDGETSSWICTEDCGGGVCVGGPSDCSSPNPAGCSTQTPCADGELCYRDGSECLPSACVCDSETDSWLCTRDCNGGRCIGGPQGCSEPNPAGCSSSNPCAQGEICMRDGGTCIPSACRCEGPTGTWLCTDDCDGGVCVGGSIP